MKEKRTTFSVGETKFTLHIVPRDKFFIDQVDKKNTRLPLTITCYKYADYWTVYMMFDTHGSYATKVEYKDMRQAIIKALMGC